MKKLLKSALITVALAAHGPVQASDKPQKANVPPPPAIPTRMPPATPQRPDVRKKPDVQIIRKSDKTIYEYRINGELRYIKVVPKYGKPYYITYPRGETGSAVRRDLDDPQTPAWIIKSW